MRQGDDIWGRQVIRGKAGERGPGGEGPNWEPRLTAGLPQNSTFPRPERTYAVLISICFGRACSGTSIESVRTPSFSCASTGASWTMPGSAMRRLTEP